VTTGGWSVPAMQPPLDIGQGLGLDQLRLVGVKEAAERLDDRLLGICDPPFTDEVFQAVRQGVWAFYVERLHITSW